MQKRKPAVLTLLLNEKQTSAFVCAFCLGFFLKAAGKVSLGFCMLSISSGMFVVNSVQPGMRLYEAP